MPACVLTAGVCALVACATPPPTGCLVEPSIGDCLARFTVRTGWPAGGVHAEGWLGACTCLQRCLIAGGFGCLGALCASVRCVCGRWWVSRPTAVCARTCELLCLRCSCACFLWALAFPTARLRSCFRLRFKLQLPRRRQCPCHFQLRLPMGWPCAMSQLQIPMAWLFEPLPTSNFREVMAFTPSCLSRFNFHFPASDTV